MLSGKVFVWLLLMGDLLPGVKREGTFGSHPTSHIESLVLSVHDHPTATLSRRHMTQSK